MKILILCTYPIEEPTHGGQLRVRNIVDAYRSAGHDVQVAGVLGSEQYPKEEGFISFPGYETLASIYPDPFLMEDYAIGKLMVGDAEWFKKISEKIKITPDVIEVVQPWLSLFCERYISENGINPVVIYSSQNVEFILKEKIVSSYLGEVCGAKAREEILGCELAAIEMADAIIGVSKDDVTWLRQITNKPILLSPNGVRPWQASAQGVKSAKDIVQNKHYALYCASAHPPNVTGFFELFGGGFGSLNPDQAMVIAGAVGYWIAGDQRLHQSAKLAERIVVAGKVSQPCLEGLLEMAHTIVLPITQGGGTNLKTAEALWSGKYVVATTVAMRGFEEFIGDQGVFVANDASEFKKTIRHVMAMDPLQISDANREKRKRVLWADCLKDLPTFAERLLKEKVE
ncbi:MAG: glycosyltransferase [Methylococcaceae bacterium]|jgi:glycosyltransferase involved in cell wall biosynthesis